MRTIMMIKQLLKDPDLVSVSFQVNKEGKLFVLTKPEDKDLEEKIQVILDKETDAFNNNIE